MNVEYKDFSELSRLYKMAKRQVGLFSVMSAPKPKRGRESEEGLSVSEEVTFDATNDPSVSELEDLRVEDENEVGTSETALDTIPGVVHLSAEFSPMISTLKSLSTKNRYLQSCWYEQFPWFSTACKKVFGNYSQYTAKGPVAYIQ